MAILAKRAVAHAALVALLLTVARASLDTDSYYYENSPATLNGLYGPQASPYSNPLQAPSPGSCPTGALNATHNPEVTQGPYYLDELLFRTDITEGQAGVPLEARITVLDVNCNPVVGAYVDVWHCNATGVYSGYTSNNPGGDLAPAPDSASRKLLQGITSGATDNTTFLRGTVQTDANGVAVVRTIVPGWYSGRVTHLHTMIHIAEAIGDEAVQYEDSRNVHTGQFFFEEELLDAVYQVYPYSRHTGDRVALADDSIFASGGSDPTQIFAINYVASDDVAAGLAGSVTAVVDTTANHTTSFSMGGPMAGGAPGMGGPGQQSMGPMGTGFPRGPRPQGASGFPQAGRRLLQQAK